MTIKQNSFSRSLLSVACLLLAGFFFYFSLPKSWFLSSAELSQVSTFSQDTPKYITKNIEDIKVGELVYAYDVSIGETVKRPVSNIFERQSDHLRFLTTREPDGKVQTIQTTDIHPFWVVTDAPDANRMAREMVSVENVGADDLTFEHKNIGSTKDGYYVEAGDLEIGDTFIGPRGEITTLENSVREEHPGGITVYNFEVEGDHNYFVIANLEAFHAGATPVLVHNSNPCAQSPVKPGDIMTYRDWKILGLHSGYEGHHPVSQRVLRDNGYNPLDAPIIVMEKKSGIRHENTVGYRGRDKHYLLDLEDAIIKGFDDPELQKFGRGPLSELFEKTIRYLDKIPTP